MRRSTCATMIVAMTIAASGSAHAGLVHLNVDGPGVSGTLSLSVAPDLHTGVLPSTPPNAVDPIGAYVITAVSGTFSDAKLGIANAAVTGLVPLNRVPPESTNLLAPYSFSLLPVANGVHEDGVDSPGFHYDNLYYPGGSPQAASDYPFEGGLFDIYGLAFTLADGNAVNLWSNGVVPPGGLTYGVGVTDGITVLDYVRGASVAAVPLPSAAPMLGSVLVIMGSLALARRRKHVLASAA